MIALVGLGLRVQGLTDKTLSHPEAWVPGIAYPEFVRALHARRTVWELVDSTAGSDRHPPGYYLAMWVWTRTWGTALGTIRLPSALAGAALIPLLYCMARLNGRVGAGVLAAALAALHGQHIFWSQQARMWVFMPLLAAASFLLLMRLERVWRRREAIAYVLVTSSGLWLQYYFWPVFVAQVLWVLLIQHDKKRVPVSLGLQTLAVILSSPTALFLRTDWRWVNPAWRGVAESSQSWLVDFLAFGNLFDRHALHDALGTFSSWLRVSMLLLGVGLAVAGVRAGVSEAESRPEVVDRKLPLSVFLGAAAAAGLFYAIFAPQLMQHVGRKWVTAGVILPWASVATWVGVERAWPTMSGKLSSGRFGSLSRALRRLTPDAVAGQFFISMLIFLAISLSSPMVVSRGLLIMTPFLIVLVARGAFFVARRRRLLGAVIVVLLMIAGVASSAQYKKLPTSPFDYQSLARAMQPLMMPGDVVVLDGEWWAEPMHFYLPGDRTPTVDVQRIIAADERELAAMHPRIWVLAFPRTPVDELAGSLSAYRQVEQVTVTTRGWGEVFECRATLYVAEG